jgi:uncharacterized protein with FMN-binding domain
MRRAPIVVVATAAGVAGVLAFHTTPARLSAGALPTASGASQTGATGRSQPGQRGVGSGSPPKQGPVARGAARTVNGPSVNYYYGVLSVSVTLTGNKITKVAIASLDDGGNARSQLIDQQSIPVLEQEVMRAQTANIQGVSGASYTSAGFEQSLQSALHRLGR